MKNLRTILVSSLLAALVIISVGCSFSVGTANLSSLKTSLDKEGTKPSTTFKDGETAYAVATVSNNIGKVKVKTYLTSNNETLKGSEVTIDLDGDGTSSYHFTVGEGLPAGSYNIVSDMINENGEKKDSNTVAIKVE